MFRKPKLFKLWVARRYRNNLFTRYRYVFILFLFFNSFSATGLLQRQHLRELLEVFAVLEGTGIREISEISDVSVLFGSVAVRAFSTRAGQFAVYEIHRRSTDSPVAALHAQKESSAANGERERKRRLEHQQPKQQPNKRTHPPENTVETIASKCFITKQTSKKKKTKGDVCFYF